MTTVRLLIQGILSFAFLLISLSTNAQTNISFTNKFTFQKSGSIDGVRLIALIPAPITNEYQEISSLSSNCGTFIDIDEANKVLFYDGSFEGQTMSIFESFNYKTKTIKIDFNNKSEKNICTEINPNKFLGNNGSYIDTNNATIQQLGNQLWEESDGTIDYAKRCYEYVASHFQYIQGSWRTLAEILAIGGGECGDFTTLFVNLMRYKGIPARHNIGVWKDGGYHVWPDFYDEDYGWIPVDPTFKNSDPAGDYFGRYDGNLIILSQGLTSFSTSDVEIHDTPLQTIFYWYWYSHGYGTINAVHQTSNDYQVDGIKDIATTDKTTSIYNLQGMKQTKLQRGINIVNGKVIYIK